MSTKKEEVIIIKQEKEEKVKIKQEIKEEKVKIKQEINFEDSFELAESSSNEEPVNKKRKKSGVNNAKRSFDKKPKSYWTLEEDQALYDAVTSIVNGKWKEVCSKHPSLAERGTRMVHQRWNTKNKYFLGTKSGNGGK